MPARRGLRLCVAVALASASALPDAPCPEAGKCAAGGGGGDHVMLQVSPGVLAQAREAARGAADDAFQDQVAPGWAVGADAEAESVGPDAVRGASPIGDFESAWLHGGLGAKSADDGLGAESVGDAGAESVGDAEAESVGTDAVRGASPIGNFDEAPGFGAETSGEVAADAVGSGWQNSGSDASYGDWVEGTSGGEMGMDAVPGLPAANSNDGWVGAEMQDHAQDQTAPGFGMEGHDAETVVPAEVEDHSADQAAPPDAMDTGAGDAGGDDEDEDSSDKVCGSCLCVFDIDRTLTGVQGDTAHCPDNKVLGFPDYGYDGGPATLSALANKGIKSTFCNKCYLGITSAGAGSGEGSEWNKYLLDEVMTGEVQDAFTEKFPDAKKWSYKLDVQSPYVLLQPDREKQHAVELIRKWYGAQERAVCIQPKNVFFYGDRTENIKPFKDMGLNSHEISCDSRDIKRHGIIGHCGARPDEIKRQPGNHLCNKN